MRTEFIEKKYLEEAVFSENAAVQPGIVQWKCPSNIALVKYWGKKQGHQLALNPSVSFTLSKSVTQIKLEYSPAVGASGKCKDFLFNGLEKADFRERIDTYLEIIAPYFPFLKRLDIKIETSNSFPYGAGIASSASGFGALALSLVCMEEELAGKKSDFYQKASFMARLGSGSACRSAYGGFALWGKISSLNDSSDYYAIPLTDHIHKNFLNYRDAILIIGSEKKTVSSSAGHRLMDNHPFVEARVKQADKNIISLLSVLKSGDTKAFSNLVEHEALTLQALMMTSNPGFILLKGATLDVISHIRQFRQDTGMPVCFTLDAGANVHLLYPGNIDDIVKQFITGKLLKYCENQQVIYDEIGNGPTKIQ